MLAQKQLRDELRFVTEFRTLCDVIQQVAISQLRRIDRDLAGQPPLVEVLAREFFPLLPAAALQDPFVRGGHHGRLLVVFTSDEGLVGPLHANVLRHAMAKADDETQWLVVGQRGLRLLGAHRAQARYIPVPSDEGAEEEMQRLSALALAHYRRNGLRDAWLVAPRFLSTARQDVVTHQLLPLPVAHLDAGAGRNAGRGPDPHRVGPEQDLVLEPSLGRVVEQLAALWVEHVCLESFWSARRAEFAARALHMEVSRHELATQEKKVRHEFFKALHGRVDVLVRETCVVQRLVARRTGRPQ